MSLTEIIFRLFAWVRPLLWYYHRLGHFLDVAILCLRDDDYCLWLFDNPEARAGFESKLVDAERCLEIAIAYRVREILGLPMPATPRMGIGGFHRLHSPTSLVRLAARLDRLVDRYNAIERLAQLRAARLKREAEAAPVLLVADHRPQQAEPSLMLIALSPVSPASSLVFITLAAGLRIRGPPPGRLNRENPAHPNPQRSPARTRPHAPNLSASSTKLPTWMSYVPSAGSFDPTPAPYSSARRTYAVRNPRLPA
jgi:hypothetical protein